MSRRGPRKGHLLQLDADGSPISTSEDVYFTAHSDHHGHRSHTSFFYPQSLESLFNDTVQTFDDRFRTLGDLIVHALVKECIALWKTKEEHLKVKKLTAANAMIEMERLLDETAEIKSTLVKFERTLISLQAQEDSTALPQMVELARTFLAGLPAGYDLGLLPKLLKDQ